MPREDRADVLDLSGKVVAQLPGRDVACVGDTHVIFHGWGICGEGRRCDGLFDLRSGTFAMEVEAGCFIDAENRHTVGIRCGDNQYYLDLTTWETVPPAEAEPDEGSDQNETQGEESEDKESESTHMLSPTLSDDGAPDGSRPATHIHNSATGTTFELTAPSRCWAEGDNWVTCYPEDDRLPTQIYSTTGTLTAFRKISTVPDARALDDAPYYWATAGSYRGFVDSTGQWLYRESRYSDLED